MKWTHCKRLLIMNEDWSPQTQMHHDYRERPSTRNLHWRRDCKSGCHPNQEKYKGILKLSHPMEHGIVKNWTHMEILWRQVYDQLKCSAQEVSLSSESVAPSLTDGRSFESLHEQGKDGRGVLRDSVCAFALLLNSSSIVSLCTG